MSVGFVAIALVSAMYGVLGGIKEDAAPAVSGVQTVIETAATGVTV